MSEPSERAVSEALMKTVHKLARDLHPRGEDISRFGLDSDLNKDFGFDSLGRAELHHRIERQFGLVLPDQLLASAQTPHDFLNALLEADVRVVRHRPETATTVKAGTVPPVPDTIESLSEVFDWHVERHPDRPHILLSNGDQEETAITYADLNREAAVVARGLREWGLQPRETVAIMLPTGRAFFLAFMGTILAGGIPVPIYPPTSPSQIEQHLRSRARILDNCQAALLIAVQEARQISGLLLSTVPVIRDVQTIEGLATGSTAPLPRNGKGSDICFLQYTSGSTGDPKGVILSHDNVLANIRAMGRAVAASPDDIYVSWLPLYHDMGLIGAWLAALYFAVPTIIMSPLHFLARPERWLWTIHRAGGTISAAPNFAYSLCAQKIADEDIEGLDLSSWRFTANAAEPVSPQTIRDFTKRLAPYGFRANAMHPSYGLAESVTGLTFAELGAGPRFDVIDRRALFGSGRAVPADASTESSAELVSCGQPLVHHEVRIVDEDGHESPEREQGRLQFRGPSATGGYYRDETKTRALFDGDWLESGDLAYIANGEVFITGRTKDVVIRAGRLIQPVETEEAIGRIDGITPGAVVMFGVPDPEAGTERLVVLAESKFSDPERKARLVSEARTCVQNILGEPPDEVVILHRHAIPKTSSGKVRRFQARENYMAGRPGGRHRPVWLQMTRVAIGSVRGRLERLRRALVSRAYAIYWWSIEFFFAAWLWPLMLILPKLSWRWAVMHRAIRVALFLQGHSLKVTAEAPPRSSDVVFVANHTSYLDSAVLTAVLPGELAFAAYYEVQEDWFKGPILRALGTLFVERFETEAALRHTKQAVETARSGRPVVFFPEATLTRMPGLLEFRMGAFVTAAEAGVPVVPIAIRGCRSALRHDLRWFPRRVPLSVHVGRPIYPSGDTFEVALDLREKARAKVLEHCGEPDLALETPRY